MGGFVERTAKEKEYVPAAADALVAMVSGCAAAVAVAPFLMCVDRGVVAAAAGTTPRSTGTHTSCPWRQTTRTARCARYGTRRWDWGQG